MSKKLIFIYRWLMWNVFSRPFVEIHLQRQYNYRSTPDSEPYPRAPFMVISNHGTFFDPWMVGRDSKSPFAIMCNDDAFKASPITVWYLNSIGAFPKKKGASDFKAMKKTMNLIKSGYPVCIFPEGQTTWDGETQLIYRGIEKIIKRARCPLVLNRIKGNFLTKPWWAQTKRTGRILIHRTVLSADKIRDMSDEELFDTMKSSIYQNEVKDPDNRQTRFRGERLAEGLERFFWHCPQCQQDDTLVTSGNEMKCSACTGCWQVDPWCRITPAGSTSASQLEDVHDWSVFHKKLVLDAVHQAREGDILASGDKVVVQLRNRKECFVDLCTGSLELTRTHISFSGESASYSYTIALDEIENSVIQKKDIFECTWRGTDYRFVFAGRSPMKWHLFVRYLRGYEQFDRQGYIQ
ncbi:MAG: hypothetical protein GF398_08635 [Chitinivibrionales bacterium]|nr:hypothetical protein [Chitinivibrionales bacterium]